MPNKRIDLREGFRVEVEQMILPAGAFGARIFTPRKTPSGRVKWDQVGKLVVSEESASAAAEDLLRMLNIGAMPGVEAADGPAALDGKESRA